ncbi:MAG TPA: hypothetical protein DHW82_05155 [Spirochaetia bacterium]|nr:MAG: hypothetical protein A2Y41_09500 [Spirochaetes bacterium GWB1_36_13]HCL56380.1 hypothetical protein [Spirochaetia bacterium]
MKKIIAFWLGMIFIFPMSLQSENVPKDAYVIQPGSPSAVVYQLLNIYKYYKFRDALKITTGKELETVKKILEAMDNNFGKPPVPLQKFISTIDDMRLIDETIKDNYSRVDVIWILKGGNSSNSSALKVNEVAYLLEKKNNVWLIRSSKFINQQVFMNYSALQDIYQKAVPFGSKVYKDQIK